MAFEDKQCHNHPGTAALSSCHACGEYYCRECLVEGQQYYFCRTAACRSAMEIEPPPEPLPVEPLIQESTFIKIVSHAVRLFLRFGR